MSNSPTPVIGTDEGLHVLGSRRTDLLDRLVTAVHADGDALWALVEQRELYRIEGDEPALVAKLDDGVGTCVGSHRGDVVVGGERAGLWRLDGSRLEPISSFLEAPTRDEWSTPWGGPPAVFSMASDGADLYVSVHVGGVLRTADLGAWAATIDLHDDVHEVAVGADGTVWAATGMRGLAESGDAGATWRYHSAGLHGTYLLAVAAVPGGALVSASTGHADRKGVLYRFDGDRFEPCADLPEDLGGAVGPGQLTAAGDGCLVALPSGASYVTDDGGRRWTLLSADLPRPSTVAMWPRR